MRKWADRSLELWRQGVVEPRIARASGLDQAAQAHHRIQDRRNVGKALSSSHRRGLCAAPPNKKSAAEAAPRVKDGLAVQRGCGTIRI